jgi:hypothetical protein
MATGMAAGDSLKIKPWLSAKAIVASSALKINIK